ncbi:MAG: long-chain fatty acid--CoA ligase [Chloroflexaceae bacterium]|jgi:acyl-CoA synthetase (AMP-forming)/AMP-acid ligase II|nr:long-chain fatty acid--CoA ligase [Chloroflexaceae bacterium]
MTITWLLERMAQWPERPAIVWHDERYSYADLLVRVATWRTELQRHGVGAGQVVTIEGDYSPNACALLLALVECGAIVVPLTRSVEAHRAEFLDIAEVQVAIAFDAGDTWHITRRDVTVRNDLTQQLINSGNPGLVLFSSGSTGKNKAALHNFTALLEKFKVPRHSRCALTFLLLDHIGGINTLFYTLANGGTVVTVAERDPEVVCQAVAAHQVQTLPTSPTFLNLLLISEAYTRHDLSSLELITYGTEVMPESTLQRLHAIFPQVQLLQTYGLSELGILRSKSRDSGSLWVKVGGEGFETKIVDGVLWVRAQSAMLGYLNAPSPFDEQGWMNTQDMVEVDGDYIRILGRRTEIINVGGQKVYPAEVESVLLQLENVRDVAVRGEANPITGQIVAARFNLFEAEELAGFKRRVRAFCKERLADYKIPVKIEVTENEQHSARFKKMRRA